MVSTDVKIAALWAAVAANQITTNVTHAVSVDTYI
jgi:hypothetical protein